MRRSASARPSPRRRSSRSQKASGKRSSRCFGASLDRWGSAEPIVLYARFLSLFDLHAMDEPQPEHVRADSGLADPGGKLIAGDRADRSPPPGKNDPPKPSNPQDSADRHA